MTDILVILPRWVGDLVMSTPMLRALRAHVGTAARVTGVMKPHFADILAGTPWLDDVVPFDRRSRDPARRFRAVARTLRARRFDTALVVGFSCTCLMFLCRPREGRDADGDHSSPAGPFPLVVAAVLITCVWLAMSSVPHVYESDRMWLLGILLGMDALMLFIHLSDTMPTMYTVLMGRLTYTVLANGILIYAYWVLPDRLQE